MRIRLFIFALLPLIFAGCTTSKNISKRDPFYDYVGQTVELRRPVSVIGRASAWTGGPGVMSLHLAQYGIIEKGTEWQGRGEYGQYGQVLAELPVGYKVRIDSVWEELVFDEHQIIAYGHMTIPPSTNEVSFAYPWGEFSKLWRAPWEPDDTVNRVPYYFNPAPGTPVWGTKIQH